MAWVSPSANGSRRWRRILRHQRKLPRAARAPKQEAKPIFLSKERHSHGDAFRPNSPVPCWPGIISKVPTTMANHSYLRVWTRDFSLETMLAEFARFLATAPLSATQPVFSELIVQAVDATETPVAEWDLRPLKAGPAEVAALALPNLNADTAY